MSSATPTLVPSKSSPDPLDVADRALGLIEKLSASHDRDPVRSAVVAALITSGLLWGAHEVLGGRAAAERHERLTERVERLEDTQTEIRIQLGAIARAVGAEPAGRK